jgi:hypothetical protein
MMRDEETVAALAVDRELGMAGQEGVNRGQGARPQLFEVSHRIDRSVLHQYIRSLLIP